jgi:hypothetical protein
MTQAFISALVGMGLGAVAVVGGVQVYKASGDTVSDRAIPTVSSPLYADK